MVVMQVISLLVASVYCSKRCSNSDPDFLVCAAEVAQKYDQCISECPRGDALCLTGCARDYDAQLNNCPCQESCCF